METYQIKEILLGLRKELQNNAQELEKINEYLEVINIDKDEYTKISSSFSYLPVYILPYIRGTEGITIHLNRRKNRDYLHHHYNYTFSKIYEEETYYIIKVNNKYILKSAYLANKEYYNQKNEKNIIDTIRINPKTEKEFNEYIDYLYQKYHHNQDFSNYLLRFPILEGKKNTDGTFSHIDMPNNRTISIGITDPKYSSYETSFYSVYDCNFINKIFFSKPLKLGKISNNDIIEFLNREVSESWLTDKSKSLIEENTEKLIVTQEPFSLNNNCWMQINETKDKLILTRKK